MKKYINIIPVTLIVMCIIFSCKKSDTPKDYTASIKDKTWWGQLTYTGQTAEYYSVHFNADNTLVWSQLSGDYSGVWVINDKQLKMTFPALGSEILGDISENDTLKNISDNNASVTINSGKLIANPNILLDNTVWKGSPVIALKLPIELNVNFLVSSNIQTQIGNNNYGTDTYTRSASGAVIRVEAFPGFFFFFVVISATEIRGNDNSNPYPWRVIKQ